MNFVEDIIIEVLQFGIITVITKRQKSLRRKVSLSKVDANFNNKSNTPLYVFLSFVVRLMVPQCETPHKY